MTTTNEQSSREREAFRVETKPNGVRFTIGVQTFTLANTEEDAEDPEHAPFMADMLTKALSALSGSAESGEAVDLKLAEDLAKLGWQTVFCDLCGQTARGLPSALPAQAVGEVTDAMRKAFDDRNNTLEADERDGIIAAILALAAPMPQAEPTDEQIVEALREEMTLYDDGASVTDKVQLVRAVRRALEAWDGTVLPKSNDGMMQERMEDLREVLSIWRDECEKAGGFVNSNAKGLLFTESALQRIGGALESLSAPQEASKPARCPNCDDTGDVHSLDGEWRARCWCPAGQLGPLQNTASKEASKVEPVAEEPAMVIAMDEGAREPRIVSWNKFTTGTHWLYLHPSPQALSDEGKPVGRVDGDGSVEWFDPIPEAGANLYARPVKPTQQLGEYEAEHLRRFRESEAAKKADKDVKHDWPACALFRGGKCTCDAGGK